MTPALNLGLDAPRPRSNAPGPSLFTFGSPSKAHVPEVDDRRRAKLAAERRARTEAATSRPFTPSGPSGPPGRAARSQPVHGRPPTAGTLADARREDCKQASIAAAAAHARALRCAEELRVQMAREKERLLRVGDAIGRPPPRRARAEVTTPIPHSPTTTFNFTFTPLPAPTVTYPTAVMFNPSPDPSPHPSPDSRSAPSQSVSRCSTPQARATTKHNRLRRGERLRRRAPYAHMPGCACARAKEEASGVPHRRQRYGEGVGRSRSGPASIL